MQLLRKLATFDPYSHRPTDMNRNTQTDTTAHTTQTRNPGLTPRQRAFKFPNALDFIVMAVWVAASQFLGLYLCRTAGIHIPQMSLMSSSDPETLLLAQTGLARALAAIYTVSMLLATAGVLLYRRLRGARGRVARCSAQGFDPWIILTGLVWIIAADVVIEPLLVLLPDVTDTVGRGFFALLVTVVLAPLFEEFLCRGIILESFRAKYGVVTAWIVSSVFFAVIHGHVTSMVNALVIGSILGYICIRARSIFASAILHAFNNGIALAAITFGFADTTFRQLMPNPAIYWSIYALCATVCLAGALSIGLRLKRISRTEKYASAAGRMQ